MQGEGIKKFILIVFVTTGASIILENGGFNLPDDRRLILVTCAAVSVQVYVWLFIRARFKFDFDIPSIIGSVGCMVIMGGILTGWTDNLLNGEKSFGVAMGDTLNSHKWQFLCLVILVALLSRKARKAMSDFGPDFEFPDD